MAAKPRVRTPVVTPMQMAHMGHHQHVAQRIGTVAGSIAGAGAGAALFALGGNPWIAANVGRYGTHVGAAVGGALAHYMMARRQANMINAMAQVKARKKPTMAGRVKNTQFEAKHRRVHGRFA